MADWIGIFVLSAFLCVPVCIALVVASQFVPDKMQEGFIAAGLGVAVLGMILLFVAWSGAYSMG